MIIRKTLISRYKIADQKIVDVRHSHEYMKNKNYVLMNGYNFHSCSHIGMITTLYSLLWTC